MVRCWGCTDMDMGRGTYKVVVGRRDACPILFLAPWQVANTYLCLLLWRCAVVENCQGLRRLPGAEGRACRGVKQFVGGWRPWRWREREWTWWRKARSWKEGGKGILDTIRNPQGRMKIYKGITPQKGLHLVPGRAREWVAADPFDLSLPSSDSGLLAAIADVSTIPIALSQNGCG